MGFPARTLWAVILLTVVVLTFLQTVGAEDELEVFAGQDKTGRVEIPLEFNDARITKPDPLDPLKEYKFSWDFDNKKDMNLDGIKDNDAQSQEMYTEWTYWIAGTYVVTLTVDDGEFETKDTLQVTIKANEPPNILANDTEIARTGVEHVFNAEAIDDASPPHLLRWYWDFDDGTTSSQPPPVLHTYNTEGTYEVTIRVTDPDNDWTQHVITLTVVEKLVTSTINIVEGETIKGTFGFMGACTSDVPLDTVEVRLDDGDWLHAEGVMEWSYLVDTTVLDHGEHTIEVRAWNGEDIYAMVTIGFDVDNPPVIEIMYPIGVPRYNGTVIARGTAGDDAWLEQVEARVDDGPWTSTDGSHEWSFTIDTMDLGYGNHTLFVRGYDGEQYSEMVTIQFYVDQVPVVFIDETREWSVTSTGLVATGSFWNDKNEPQVEIRVDGGAWSIANVGPQYPPPLSWRLEINTTGLAQGGHILEARAFDGYQFSSLASTPFHTDRPPEVTIDPMPDDREVKTKLLLSGALSDDGTVERIEYRIDRTEWVNFTADENWSIEVPVKGLSEGLHTIEVRVYDGSNWSNIATTTFRKEKDEEPGFGAALVALAILGSAVIAISRKH